MTSKLLYSPRPRFAMRMLEQCICKALRCNETPFSPALVTNKGDDNTLSIFLYLSFMSGDRYFIIDQYSMCFLTCTMRKF